MTKISKARHVTKRGVVKRNPKRKPINHKIKIFEYVSEIGINGASQEKEYAFWLSNYEKGRDVWSGFILDGDEDSRVVYITVPKGTSRKNVLKLVDEDFTYFEEFSKIDKEDAEYIISK